MNKENQTLKSLTTIAALNARLNELEDIRNDFEIGIQQEIKATEEKRDPDCRQTMAFCLVCNVVFLALFLGLGFGYRKYSSDQAQSQSDSIRQFLSSCTGDSPTSDPIVWKTLTDCSSALPATEFYCSFSASVFYCNLDTCLTSIKNFCAIGDLPPIEWMDSSGQRERSDLCYF